MTKPSHGSWPKPTGALTVRAAPGVTGKSSYDRVSPPTYTKPLASRSSAYT